MLPVVGLNWLGFPFNCLLNGLCFIACLGFECLLFGVCLGDLLLSLLCFVFWIDVWCGLLW